MPQSVAADVDLKKNKIKYNHIAAMYETAKNLIARDMH
jgi:hypothetical protein